MKLRLLFLSLGMIFMSLAGCFSQDMDSIIAVRLHQLYRDSVFINILQRNDGTELKMQSFYILRDSASRLAMTDYVQKELAPAGRLTWPASAVDRSSYEYTPTYTYLLAHTYHIGAWPVSGCITPDYQAYYDTAMANEICKKYGAGFFETSFAKAQRLDSSGLGLTLPYAETPGGYAAYVRNMFPIIDTLKGLEGQKIGHMILYFSGGVLKEAALAENYLGWFQPALGKEQYIPVLTKLLLQLKWTGPCFEGEPVEKHVMLDVRNDKLYFDNDW